MRKITLILTLSILASAPLNVLADPPSWCDETPPNLQNACGAGCEVSETDNPTVSCFSGPGGGCCLTDTYTTHCVPADDTDPDDPGTPPPPGGCNGGSYAQSTYNDGMFCCQGATTTAYACRPYDECYGD